MSTSNHKSVKSSGIGNLSKTGEKKPSSTGTFIKRDAKSGKINTSVRESVPLPPTLKGRTVKASIDSSGRILVPAKLRKALDLAPGDEVNLTIKGDVLEIRTLDDTISDAQALVRKYVPKKKSLVNELINERRADAAKE